MCVGLPVLRIRKRIRGLFQEFFQRVHCSWARGYYGTPARVRKTWRPSPTIAWPPRAASRPSTTHVYRIWAATMKIPVVLIWLKETSPFPGGTISHMPWLHLFIAGSLPRLLTSVLIGKLEGKMLTGTREYKSHSFNLETDIALFSVVTFRISHPLTACLRHDFSTFLTSTFRIFQRPSEWMLSRG